MITNRGLMHIKRYLAGETPSIALSMAFGVGSSAPSADSDRLDYEVGRSTIDLSSYDFVQDKLIFRAVLDENFDATIHEVGLFSLDADGAAGDYGSGQIVSFDSETEEWTQAGNPATFTTANTRVGADSLTISLNASGSVTVVSASTTADLAGFSDADMFYFAFWCSTANLSSVRYRFKSDANNYYDVTVPAASISTGFNIAKVTKGSAVVTGSPDWGQISSLEVTASAKSSGAVVVNLEGIRIEDMDTNSLDYTMVSRVVLPQPFDKVSGRIQEIEFPLGVTVVSG